MEPEAIQMSETKARIAISLQIFHKKISCNKNTKITWKCKFCIAWTYLLTVLGKSTNLNYEDNIIPYYDLDDSVVNELTKHLYDNKYKIYLIRFPPQFHCNKSSHWKCSIKKLFLKLL